MIAAGLISLSAMAALVYATASPGGRGRATAAIGASDPAAVAAAYRFPLRCLAVTFSAADPAYARVRLARARSCGRYGGWATVIFRHGRNGWRAVLQSADYLCPVRSLPAIVQAQLHVCPPPLSERY
jgi:hypothetical protein